MFRLAMYIKVFELFFSFNMKSKNLFDPLNVKLS